MDKYEYKLKLEQLKNLLKEQDYKTASEIADTMNWRKVKNAATLCMVGEIYDKMKRYEDSREILLMAYDRATVGRNIIYRLTLVALKLGNMDEAKEYYDEFLEIAPYDNLKYVLRYEIAKVGGTPLGELIAILEEYKEREYTEEWAFELAYLYHRAGNSLRCVEICDELILWFGEGKYVEKALELKMLYQPLNQQQEEKYRQFKQHKEGIVEVAPCDVLESGEIVRETVQIPKVISNTGRFSTINLQKELAKSMQQIIDAGSDEMVTDTIDNIKKMVEEIPYLNRSEESMEFMEENAMEFMKEEWGEAEKEEPISSTEEDFMRFAKKAPTSPVEDYTGFAEDQTSPVEDYTGFERKDQTSPVEDYTGFAEDQTSPVEKDFMRFAEKDQTSPVEDYTGFERKAPTSPVEDYTGFERKAPTSPVEDYTGFERKAPTSPVEDYTGFERKAPTSPVEDYTGFERKAPTSSLEEDFMRFAKKAPTSTVEEDFMRFAKKAPTSTVEEDFTGFAKKAPTSTLEEDFMRFEKEEPEDFTQIQFSKLLSEDSDGQISLCVSECFQKEPQINGQMSIQDLIEEWEKRNQEQEALLMLEEQKKLDMAKTRALQEAEDIMDRLTDVLPKLNTEVLQQNAMGEPEMFVEEGLKELNIESAEIDIDKIQEALAREETSRISFGDTKEIILKKDDMMTERDLAAEVRAGIEVGFEQNQELDFPEIDMEEALVEEETITSLNEEQKEIFSYFVPVTGMEQQLCQVLEGSLHRRGNSRNSVSGNIIIMGGRGSGKTVLATDMIKVIQKSGGYSNGKVGKISAISLNQKELSTLIKKIAGGYLIIEKAGDLSQETVTKLSILMEQDTQGLMVILEDTRAGIEKVMNRDPNFSKKFTERIKIPVFTSDELVEFAKAYAKEEECEIDDMGILALYNCISNIQRLDEATTLTEVKEIMDEAIAHADKGGLKKIFGGKKYSPQGYLYLREKDFSN